METITLLKEKLLEARHERDAYENKMNRLLRDAESAKDGRDKMGDTIKSLEQSIHDMRALTKPAKATKVNKKTKTTKKKEKK